MEKLIEWDLFPGMSPDGAPASDESIDRDLPLIKAAANGDDDAFRQLVERYQDRIYRFAYQWIGNVDDAREVSQDTFVRAYLALGRYEKRGKFSTWLYRIAWNLCRDRTRKKSFRQQSRTDSLDGAADLVFQCRSASPDDSAETREELKQLLCDIDQLPDQLKGAVILCGFEGLSHEAAAEILNCSARAVEGRLYRARKSLTQHRKDRESGG